MKNVVEPSKYEKMFVSATVVSGYVVLVIVGISAVYNILCGNVSKIWPIVDML